MRENIIIFNNMIRGLFPDCIQNIPEKGRELESSIEVTYKFSKQIFLKNFVDKINKEGKVNIKIATKEEGGRVYHVLGYSNPTEEKMYIVHLASIQCGITDSMTVCFYESIEEMYIELLSYYNKYNSTNAIILESESNQITLTRFY